MEALDRMAKRRRLEEPTTPELLLRATEATDAANPRPPGEGGDGVDRISGLPDAVLGEIVSLLSTKEAARTQILASRWRHIWRATPLVLDGNDLYAGPEVNRFLYANLCTTAVATAMSLILSAHPGPGRRFCIHPCHLQERPDTVDAWLRSPALDNLQELDFWGDMGTMMYFRPYPLAPPPASTFRFSATLQVATFGRCVLLDISLEGIQFPQLKQLALEGVSISESSLHTMISSCPVLECLLLKDNIGFACVRISSNSIRCIGVDANRYTNMGNRYNMDNDDNLELQEVMIVDAPCLERFLYLHQTVKKINVTVISAPKLETFGSLSDRPPSRVVFGTTVIKGLNVVSFATALTNIKILTVSSTQINLDMVIELMKCFPCLEKLYIQSSRFHGLNRWRRKHRDFIKSFDIRLKTIVLKQYRGIRSQVNFASFFLLNARHLESMRLNVEDTDYNEAFLAEQHKMLQMEKRASRSARLHFTANKCYYYHIRVNHVRDLSIADPFEYRC